MPEIFADMSPAWPLIVLGALCALSPSHFLRKGAMIAAPLLSLLCLLAPASLQSMGGQFTLFGFQLTTYRLDGLSFPFGLVFIIAAFLNGIYALHERNRLTDAAALIYSGAAVGAVFAGDLISLFVFWELTAVSSVFLVWAGGSTASIASGMRYLAMHVLSGVLILGGVAAIYVGGDELTFGAIGLEAGFAGWMIFLGFGVKAAFPLLHNWLEDAYPNATVTGTVVLSVFTTKMAVYALARGYAGEELLVWIGAIMAVFPLFYAMMENDLRRLLSYSLNTQLGFMLAGVGVGTALAINGAVAHAFASVVYQALLFMGVGAVLHRTGTARVSDLGGLFKSMPLTALFTIIGGLAIATFPLMSGFVAKAMTLSALAQEGYGLPWFMLVFATAGVLAHTGLKTPYFAFFGQDSGRRPAEAPFNMLVAMGLAAAICVFLGLPIGGYQWFYSIMPNDYGYDPYTRDHVLTQFQLLIGATAAFAALLSLGLYPRDRRGVTLDFDWVYRRFGYFAARWLTAMLGRLSAWTGHGVVARGKLWNRRLQAVFHPAGAFSRALPSGSMAIWTAILLGVALIIAYQAG